MKEMPRRNGTLSTTLVVVLMLLITGAMVDAAIAQENGDGTRVRTREGTQDQMQDPQGDMLRQRIRDRIENEEGLQDQERERLRQHLGECDQLGLADEVTAALFAQTEPLRKQIRLQERVLAMAREGLPVEPVTQKLQEGRRKGANEQTLEQACTRMETNVRAANRFMQQAREDGVKPGAPDAERRRTREMATQMWRGLSEGDMSQLRERARLRLRDGSCTTEELAAAAETATNLKDMRVERHRAVRLAGEALQYGYSAHEMRQLRWMVMTANTHGGRDEVLETLEQGIRNQHQFTRMIQQMRDRGWMGPADEHGGRGGRGTMDDATGNGPGGHHGGDGDKDSKGGGGKQGGGQQNGG